MGRKYFYFNGIIHNVTRHKSEIGPTVEDPKFKLQSWNISQTIFLETLSKNYNTFIIT